MKYFLILAVLLIPAMAEDNIAGTSVVTKKDPKPPVIKGKPIDELTMLKIKNIQAQIDLLMAQADQMRISQCAAAGILADNTRCNFDLQVSKENPFGRVVWLENEKAEAPK